MKIIHICFLCFFSSALFSQSSIYHAFPESNAVWRVNWGEQACFISGLAQAEYQYVQSGDTLINSVHYHQIHREMGLAFACGPYYPSGIGYMGGLRQDTSLKKVFFLPVDSLSEKVLYDFSLSVGDTLPNLISKVYGNIYPTVNSIDSMLIGADYRKVFNTTAGTILEGIGNLAGLLEISQLDLTPELLCFTQDSTDIYKVHSSADCELITALKSIVPLQIPVSFYPNPFRTQARINVRADYINSDLILFNLFGEKVRIVKLSGQDLILDRGDLANGLYFFRISNVENNACSGKILLN